jgi:acyl-CoA reductase-like NAD-dependent aldehyde dehydrogenase
MEAIALTPIRSPFDDSVVGEVAESTRQDVETALHRAHEARPVMAGLTAYQRGQILDRTSDLIAGDIDGFARLMAQESGKPMRYSRGEVQRAVETFAFAADAARHLHGETIPLDAAKTGAGRIGYFIREPIGVIAAVTPFNFPLNLVAHKVAPAIAAGCPLLLKPNPQTPLTALRLAQKLTEAGLPDGALSVLIGGADVGGWMTTDARVSMISFTGSVPVARSIAETAGLRRTTFELGGNAAVIVDDTADLEASVDRSAVGAFAYSGQVCISVQRIYVHVSRYHEFRDRLVARVNRMVMGDPLEAGTEIGPLINDAAAERIESWVREAVQQGASILTGGIRSGRMVTPTVLENVSSQMKVMSAEVFGPVVSLVPFEEFDAALDAVNNSEFGLQAGVFTRDLSRAMRAVSRLEVGGVIINDSPTFRVDHMPYGGNKNSGVGREGPRFAIEDMTTLKMVVITP